ncbi:AbrB/MazE/SpoVT family DNA-binding domain-containing protein [Novosphingobium sp. G106]|nr:AbrB/MazE/SpoVT family DNA-binding domain-containing protein [Novosphingobium sp. G106]
MTAQTKLSAKGQVVIPKDVRDRLGWPQGSQLELVETGDGVLLRKRPERKKMTVEEATARLRQIYRHEGPPIPIEQLSWSPDIDDPELDA